MKYLNSNYMESAVSNFLDIISNIYYGVIVDKVAKKFEADEIDLAKAEIDKQYKEFLNKQTPELEDRIEDCFAYTIIHYGEFYFELPVAHYDETPKCVSAEIALILEDVLKMGVTKLFPQNTKLKVYGDVNEVKIGYEKYCGVMVGTKHEKVIKNEKFNELEK